MIVREDQPGEHSAIHDLVEAAFGQAAEADLVDQLRRDGDAVISLVAVDDGDAIAGHVLLSRMRAPFRALGLAPVSVRPDRQGSGVGRALVRAALARAAAEGWEAVFVLGDVDWYRGFGFDPALAAGFGSPYAGPHLMALALRDGLPATTGEIAYAPAFAALG